MSKADRSIVADVGGTNIRLAIASQQEAPLQCVEIFRCAEFERIEDVIALYCERHLKSPASLHSLCLALPGPVIGDEVDLVNNPWIINRREIEEAFSCRAYFLNDFGAQAWCLSGLNKDELQWLRPPADISAQVGTQVVVGPGTGLGVAARLSNDTVLETEAGHINFAPTSDLQSEILRILQRFFPAVSNELLVSGPGLANIYRALTLIEGSDQRMQPEEITSGAREGDRRCVAAITEFNKAFGAVCGDMCLAYGAAGGVYLSGGVLDKLGELFDEQCFLEQFQAKGRFEEYCRRIPVACIRAEYPGLLGATEFLRRQTNKPA